MDREKAVVSWLRRYLDAEEN